MYMSNCSLATSNHLKKGEREIHMGLSKERQSIAVIVYILRFDALKIIFLSLSEEIKGQQLREDNYSLSSTNNHGQRVQ